MHSSLRNDVICEEQIKLATCKGNSRSDFSNFKAAESLNFTQLTAWHFVSYEREFHTTSISLRNKGNSQPLAHVLATANESQETHKEVKSMLRAVTLLKKPLFGEVLVTTYVVSITKLSTRSRNEGKSHVTQT